jgi:demethylmenaquinone methyltransferase / 2-methoxy-6-polyprenyl-1,4-benzoquinol methylase
MTYPLNEFYSRIYKRYDLINCLFTFGMDRSWRRFTVRKCLQYNPDRILDLCCGTGDLAISLASMSDRKIHITGFDRNAQMLEIAKFKTTGKGCNPVHYVLGDASQLPFEDESFDCITIGFGFRNLTYENPEAPNYLKEMRRVLKKGGSLLILESGIPENKIIRLFFKAYLYTVLIPIGLLFSGDREAYRYLAQSSAGYYTTDELRTLIYGHGFTFSERKKFFLGAANLIIAIKPQ